MSLAVFLALAVWLSAASPQQMKADLDGSWLMTRFLWTTNTSTIHVPSVVQCGKQDRISWTIHGKTFIQAPTKPDVMFGSSGIWDILELIPTASGADHESKSGPMFFKFRAYREGVTPADLCVAVQVLPAGSIASKAADGMDPSSRVGPDEGAPELSVMVNSTDPKQCPSRWVQFGGRCAKGVDFLTGKCQEGACLERSSNDAPTATKPGDEPSVKSNQGVRLQQWQYHYGIIFLLAGLLGHACHSV